MKTSHAIDAAWLPACLIFWLSDHSCQIHWSQICSNSSIPLPTKGSPDTSAILLLSLDQTTPNNLKCHFLHALSSLKNTFMPVHVHFVLPKLCTFCSVYPPNNKALQIQLWYMLAKIVGSLKDKEGENKVSPWCTITLETFEETKTLGIFQIHIEGIQFSVKKKITTTQ